MSTATSSAIPNGKNAQNKSSPTANVKPNRLPAPTLFVGPPSRNASHLSISRQQTHESHGTARARDPFSRGKSFNHNNNNGRNPPEAETSSRSSRRSSSDLPAPQKAHERSIEAKWKELQSTLNEVELTAQSSQHVFGAAHATALDELRRAQVELARAWGRGQHQGRRGDDDGGGGGGDAGDDRFDPARPPGGGGEGEDEGEGEGARPSAGLEDDTARDIHLARQRRAANEAYFHKVERGVREVVRKLDVVAEAMRHAEGESRSLWSQTTGSTEAIETRAGGGGSGE